MLSLGVDLNGIAQFLETTPEQVEEWRGSKPEMYQAFIVGQKSCKDQIEFGVAQRAKGYDYTVTHLESGYQGDKFFTKTKIITTHHPPDIAAAKLYLYNKDPDNWRESVEIVDTKKTITVKRKTV